jgi:hypothetical protein
MYAYINFKNTTDFIHILKMSKKNIILIKTNKFRSVKSINFSQFLF